jgi:hypothetical protein
LVLRGEITLPLPEAAATDAASAASALDALRSLPMPFEELAAEDMGTLGTLCKGCGADVAAEFMRFVMQHRAGAGGAPTELEPEPEEPMPGSRRVAAASGDSATVLLHIDHMNDSASYIRTLETWSSDLGLGAVVVLYRMRTKPVNASSGGKSIQPKGRAEEIWVLLDGTMAGTTKFLARLRTQRLTAQDRHERKSTVVWDSNSGSCLSHRSTKAASQGFVAQRYT